MKGYMKLSLCLIITMMIVMTFAAPSRHGEKMHFQDSSDLEQLNIDERPGQVQGHGNRNHRGRGRGHQKHDIPVFEEGIPGEYPIRGPPQAPFVLPSHPGQGVGLEKKKENNIIIFPAVQTPNNSPTAPQPQLSHQPLQQLPQNPYANNPFLANAQKPSVIPTNKYNTQSNPGVTNQLPTSDKPATTTPSYANPRRTDLLYGSNLLEEEAREGKAVTSTTDINFDDRGLFDTAPHCQAGQILVNNKCRVAV